MLFIHNNPHIPHNVHVIMNINTHVWGETFMHTIHICHFIILSTLKSPTVLIGYLQMRLLSLLFVTKKFCELKERGIGIAEKAQETRPEIEHWESIM